MVPMQINSQYPIILRNIKKRKKYEGRFWYIVFCVTGDQVAKTLPNINIVVALKSALIL